MWPPSDIVTSLAFRDSQPVTNYEAQNSSMILLAGRSSESRSIIGCPHGQEVHKFNYTMHHNTAKQYSVKRIVSDKP